VAFVHHKVTISIAIMGLAYG